MRVCLVAYTIYESDPRVRRYAESLVSGGHRVDVLALRRDRREARHGRLNGVHVYRILTRDFGEKGPLGYFFRILLYILLGGIWLAGRHVAVPYQVIHVHNIPDYLVFMAALPKLWGARVVLDIHDIFPELFCEKFGLSMESPLARAFLLMEKLSVRFADQIIVANDLWRHKLIERNRLDPLRCLTLLNYPSKAWYNHQPARPPRPGPTLVYPGTISYLHGVDVAVRAMAILRRELPQARLRIYGRSGSAEYLQFIRRLIEELDLQEVVRIYPPVPSDGLRKIYGEVDIGIVPKRAGIFSREAFSTKIFDYMAAGLPVVASRTPIDEYYFDDSMIHFFQPEDPEDLACRVAELYGDPSRQRALVESCLRYIESNTWEMKRHLYHGFIGVNGLVPIHSEGGKR